MYKVFIKGNYFFVIDPDGNKFSCHKNKAIIYNDESDSLKYDIKIPGKRFFNGLLFSEIVDVNSVAYKSQDEFEDWYTKCTGTSIGGFVSDKNTYIGTVSAGGFWQGEPELQFSTIGTMISVLSDQDGALKIFLSSDGITFFPIREFPVIGGLNEPHQLKVSRSWFYVRFENAGIIPANVSIETILGNDGQLITPLNAIVQQDADATMVRGTDFNMEVAESKRQNKLTIRKDGANTDISSISVPEDVWNGGGVYTGFPVGVIQNGMAVSTNAGDTGIVTFFYLDSETATTYLQGTVQLNGLTPVSLGVNIWRCNYATYDTGDNTTFNLGSISIYHEIATANVFVIIPIGTSISANAGYTVPFGSVLFIDRIYGSIRGLQTGTMDGAFWYREFGTSPRLRFPFVLQFGSLYFDDVDFLEFVPGRVDLIPRILFSSTNNLAANVGYRFVEEKVIPAN